MFGLEDERLRYRYVLLTLSQLPNLLLILEANDKTPKELFSLIVLNSFKFNEDRIMPPTPPGTAFCIDVSNAPPVVLRAWLERGLCSVILVNKL